MDKQFFKDAAAQMWPEIQKASSYRWQLGPDEPAIVKVSATDDFDQKLMDEDRYPVLGEVVEFDWNNTGDIMLIRNEQELAESLESVSGRALYHCPNITLEEFVVGE